MIGHILCFLGLHKWERVEIFGIPRHKTKFCARRCGVAHRSIDEFCLVDFFNPSASFQQQDFRSWSDMEKKYRPHPQGAS